MSDQLRVALVQLDVADGDPERNLARAIALIESAPPADLYLLPELWTTGYALASWPSVARDTTPSILEALGALARRLGATVGGSVITLRSDGGLANRFTLISPAGTVVAAYDKAHLFAPMGEPDHLRPGAERVRSPAGPFTAGLSVCFDLRFPEMYRLDALDGADLYLVVSAWPTARVEIMATLARARAIENQAFMALCNRAGTGADGTAFGGRSCIIAPDGQALATASSAEAVLGATLSRSSVAAVRARSPLLTQRSAGVDWRE